MSGCAGLSVSIRERGNSLVHKVERLAVAAVAIVSVAGCGGGAPRLDLPEGATSPEQAVDGFLRSAQEALRSRSDGNFTEADRAYARMAAVFGTEGGSVHRSMASDEVRDRMIVLAACLRPVSFRLISESDPLTRDSGKAGVTAEMTRQLDTLTLPFSIVRGRGGRWFIDHIDLSSVSC